MIFNICNDQDIVYNCQFNIKFSYCRFIKRSIKPSDNCSFSNQTYMVYVIISQCNTHKKHIYNVKEKAV